MQIGVDIDGTLGDLLGLSVNILNKKLNRNVTVEEVYDYDLAKVFGISKEEIIGYFTGHEHLLFDTMMPLDEAPHFLSLMYQDHRIIIVTARPPRQEVETRRWLEQHGLPFHQLVMLGNHDKHQSASQLALDLLIDDRLQTALDVTAQGIPVILIDAPHNRGDLPAGVTRCRRWFEVYRVVQQMAGTDR